MGRARCAHRTAVHTYLFAAWTALLFIATPSFAVAASVQADLDQLLAAGKFQQARNLATRRLAAAPRETRPEIEFELARIDRIAKDYPLTEPALYYALRQHVRDLTWDEYQAWIREGKFDCRDIDGERRFMVSSVSNLFFRSPHLRSRRLRTTNPTGYEKRLVATCRAIIDASRKEGKPYVLPHRFDVHMSLSVAANAAPEGALTRVWLPIPRHQPQQDGFRLLDSSSPVRHVAAESSPLRSLLLEQTAEENRENVFEIRYTYTTRGVRFDLDPDLVTRDLPGEMRRYLGEESHVFFTPEIRELTSQIAGARTNPMLVAKSFYDWISANIQYSYATEYSTIRNISEYCLQRRYGDCGQQALLFIALCRVSGIPARWQSGWSTFPGAQTMHDWTEIYLAPYGWIPVDPYMGGYAAQYAQNLSGAERKLVADFYFGGLDPYRLVANNGHCLPLEPPKLSLRSDPVDFQRGEAEFIRMAHPGTALETGGAPPAASAENIYFDRYQYALSIKSARPNP